VFSLKAGVPAVTDAVVAKILDPYLTKHSGIKYATSSACTVLSVDQVCRVFIMFFPSVGLWHFYRN